MVHGLISCSELLCLGDNYAFSRRETKGGLLWFRDAFIAVTGRISYITTLFYVWFHSLVVGSSHLYECSLTCILIYVNEAPAH